ncbi:hypothetical protein Tfer_0781 [Thermincola ferriacetica]|uniref:MoaD/ThiS family protein n=1 Tax=Thermincola ferriacetica TaxID=281456 RepID=A0A0L6W4U2_9FIRM|nr:MoaD/ThiS family protein [Thermincola ferriacetica]KNZ70597.1 hypothetical protein Tfer_0781 [Thermincola ferriacetica]
MTIGKVTVYFCPPLNSITKKEKLDIPVEENIKLTDLEEHLIKQFPALANLSIKHIYYVIGDKSVSNREFLINAGEKVKLLFPMYGG